MPGSRDHLQLVGGRRLRVRPEPRMQVATQAIFAGPQEHRVFAMTPQASGRGYGHIAVRVGRVLVYLEDRDALQAWTTAIGKAADLAEAAFGPDLPSVPVPARQQQAVEGRPGLCDAQGPGYPPRSGNRSVMRHHRPRVLGLPRQQEGLQVGAVSSAPDAQGDAGCCSYDAIGGEVLGRVGLVGPHSAGRRRSKDTVDAVDVVAQFA